MAKVCSSIKKAVEREATIIGYAQTNIPWIKEHKQTLQKQAQRKQAQNPILTTLNSTIKSSSKYYQPGGTATMIHNK